MSSDFMIRQIQNSRLSEIYVVTRSLYPHGVVPFLRLIILGHWPRPLHLSAGSKIQVGKLDYAVLKRKY